MDLPSPASASTPGRSPLLGLPPELRLHIYDYLGPCEPKSYPFGRFLISSVDRRAPPTALMATCRCLHDEILDHFYNTVTFRAMEQTFPDAWSHQTARVALRRVKRIEIRLSWRTESKRPLHEGLYTNSRWLASMIRLLLQEAKSLETVAMSVIDFMPGADWSSKEKLMEPLKELVPRVALRLGEVIAVDDDDGDGKEVELRERLQRHLDALNSNKLLQ